MTMAVSGARAAAAKSAAMPTNANAPGELPDASSLQGAGSVTLGHHVTLTPAA